MFVPRARVPPGYWRSGSLQSAFGRCSCPTYPFLVLWTVCLIAILRSSVFPELRSRPMSQWRFGLGIGKGRRKILEESGVQIRRGSWE